MKALHGMSSEAASDMRRRGLEDALDFAFSIGLDEDYKNDPQAKKDVIDPSGDAHSIKSGKKKWQIFLYSLGRFESDDAFGAMKGIGGLLESCIKSFPATFAEYQQNKLEAKERLRVFMRQLAEKLQDKRRLRAFLNKSLFNGGEVNYLTVRQDVKFHVFRNIDVVAALAGKLEVCNSAARSAGQVPEQKVIFRHKGKNLAELEMRNDSTTHYREVRFNMLKPRAMDLLFAEIPFVREFNKKVYLYGAAAKTFGNWDR